MSYNQDPQSAVASFKFTTAKNPVYRKKFESDIPEELETPLVNEGLVLGDKMKAFKPKSKKLEEILLPCSFAMSYTPHGTHFPFGACEDYLLVTNGMAVMYIKKSLINDPEGKYNSGIFYPATDSTKVKFYDDEQGATNVINNAYKMAKNCLFWGDIPSRVMHKTTIGVEDIPTLSKGAEMWYRQTKARGGRIVSLGLKLDDSVTILLSSYMEMVKALFSLIGDKDLRLESSHYIRPGDEDKKVGLVSFRGVGYSEGDFGIFGMCDLKPGNHICVRLDGKGQQAGDYLKKNTRDYVKPVVVAKVENSFVTVLSTAAPSCNYDPKTRQLYPWEINIDEATARVLYEELKYRFEK
jgi:hypothetical protein